MPKSLLAIIFILTSICVQAGTLHCSSGDHRQESYGDGLRDVLELYCKDSKSQVRYDVLIDGHGPALRSELFGKSSIVCPGSSSDEIEGEYFGLKFEIAAILGVRGGVFYHSSNAFCIISGLDGGLGISVVGANMKIMKSH